jgi:hypothetical protein
LPQGSFSSASGISDAEDKKRLQEMAGVIPIVNQTTPIIDSTPTAKVETEEAQTNLWVAILAYFFRFGRIMQALGLKMAGGVTMNMLVRAVKNYQRGDLSQRLVSRVWRDFIFNLANLLRKGFRDDDSLTKFFEVSTSYFTSQALGDFMDISDMIDATNQEVLTFVGVRGFIVFFDNYLARQLPSWLTSVIRNDEFYLGERVTVRDLERIQGINQTPHDEGRLGADVDFTSTYGMGIDNLTMRRLRTMLQNIGEQPNRVRANHALEFIRILSITKPKSRNTVLGVLKDIVNNADNGLPNLLATARQTLERGGVVNLQTVARALGRRVVQSDIDTIMARSIRDAWKLENDADTYQSPGGENRRFEGDTGFEDRLRDMTYIDVISGVSAFSNFRDLFN